MSQPESFTAAQAADPSTPGQVLADIAALRPDLRPAVAGNPSAYPGLIEWLKGLGEPAVDAAIAARSAAPTQQMPAPAPEPAPAPAPAPTQQLPTTPPAPSWAGQSTPAAAPTPAPMPAPMGAPAPAYGAPPSGPAYGGPPQGMPPQGMPPQGAYTPGYAGGPPKKSKAGLIIGIIVGVLLLIGLGAFLLIKFVFDKATDVIDDLDPSQAMEYGDNAMLDGLWDRCADEDWQACDDLYDLVKDNRESEYFEFADTCGGAWTSGTTTYCVDAMGGGDTGDTGDDSGDTGDTGDTGDDAGDAGDDTGTEEFTGAQLIYYEALSDACAAEDWAACDELWRKTPSGSTYEAFGDTCGNRSSGDQFCVNEFGDGVDEPTENRGDSPGMDALWDACEGGNGDACDLLWQVSPAGSEYEAFADSQRL